MVAMTDTTALCEAATKHLHQKEITDAIDLFEQALEIDERCGDAHAGIATAYYLGKDYHSAAEHFKRVTLLRPMDGKSLINYGGVLNILKRYSEAITVLQKGSLKEKKSFEAFYNLGLAYKNMNQSSMAISAYREAIRLSSESVDAHQNIANVYLDMKNFRKAVEHYQKAIELNPDFQKAQMGLDHATALQKDAKQNISPFGRLVDVSQQSRAVTSVERKLTAEERHADQMAVKQSSRKGEQAAIALLNLLKDEFEPTILKLNRSVAEMHETPWQLTEAGDEFRVMVRKFVKRRKELKQFMQELHAHEETINASQ